MQVQTKKDHSNHHTYTHLEGQAEERIDLNGNDDATSVQPIRRIERIG